MTVLDRIVAWAKQESSIQMILLVGSRAEKAQPDELADYDLSFFCTGELTFLFDSVWLRKFGKVWVAIPERIITDGQVIPTRLVIFEGGTKVDFAFYPVGCIVGVFEPYRMLLDKSGLEEKIRPKREEAVRPAERQYMELVNEFWFEAYHVAKYLKRQDLWLVKTRAAGLNSLLLQMLYLQTERIVSGAPGKDLQKWVEPDIWEALQGVFAHFDAEDSWHALERCIGLFRRAATEVAAKHDWQYPSDLDRDLTEFIHKLSVSS